MRRLTSSCTSNRGRCCSISNLPLGAVLGTFGVERHAITFHGQAAHSGSTPMNRRKDAFLAAAKMSPEIYRIAERSGTASARSVPAQRSRGS